MNQPQLDVVELHRTYCQASGLEIPLRFQRLQSWHLWQQAGFTQSDLILVISYLKKQIRIQARNPGCLRFRNLIEQLDYFDEELALARKDAHPRQRPPEIQPGVQKLPGGGERAVELPAPPNTKALREEAPRVFAQIKNQLRHSGSNNTPPANDL